MNLTAGANEKLRCFFVSAGFSVVFSGMRVTRHDERSA